MRLVEGFAVVCIRTPSHFISPTESHLHKPVRIGKRLARHADDVSLPCAQNLFGLLKRRYAARGDDWRVEATLVHCLLDCRNEWNTATEWSNGIRQHCRHALVTTLTRVRVNG